MKCPMQCYYGGNYHFMRCKLFNSHLDAKQVHAPKSTNACIHVQQPSASVCVRVFVVLLCCVVNAFTTLSVTITTINLNLVWMCGRVEERDHWFLPLWRCHECLRGNCLVEFRIHVCDFRVDVEVERSSDITNYYVWRQSGCWGLDRGVLMSCG